MSMHNVRIIEIAEVRPHPNAERLAIVPVGGWQAVVAKDQFAAGDRAIYIEPDYVVPLAHPQFAFLAKRGQAAAAATHRLRAVRLRGEVSFGLLIELPPAWAHRPVGSDVMSDLGITRFIPPARLAAGGSDDHELPATEAPRVHAPKFDVENLLNHPDVLVPGEDVVVTEKVDGGNARYCVSDGVFHMGSRNRWLRGDRAHVWSRAAASMPRIETWCRANPGAVLYGEVYGPVQALRYGHSEPRFVAFAAIRGDDASGNGWIDQPALFASLAAAGVVTAPVLYGGPLDIERIRTIAEHDSRVALAAGLAGHPMEGVVIVPAVERRHPDIGRVALKYISNRFWTS